MGELFNTNNAFWIFVGKLVDAMILGLIWIIFCIPIITIGPATTAVYYITLKMVRDEEGYMIQSFLKSFKQNFKQGVLLELIYIILGLFFAFDIYVYYEQNTQTAGILLMLFLILSFVLFMSFLYVFPLLSKFSNSTKNLFRNSLVLPFRHFFSTVLILLEFAGSIVIVYLLLPMVIFMPGVFMFVSSYHFRNIFDIYCEQIIAYQEGKAKEEEGSEDASEETSDDALDEASDETQEEAIETKKEYVFGDSEEEE